MKILPEMYSWSSEFQSGSRKYLKYSSTLQRRALILFHSLAHISGKTERIFIITDTLYLDKEVPVRFWNPSGSHPDPESGYRFWIRTRFTPAEVSKNVVVNRARIHRYCLIYHKICHKIILRQKL